MAESPPMNRRRAAKALGAVALALFANGATAAEWSGHLKGRGLYDALPSNSLFRNFAGADALTAESEFRLKVSARRDRWSFDADYQAYGIAGDAVRIADSLSLPGGPATAGVLDDQRRWFDLQRFQLFPAATVYEIDPLALEQLADFSGNLRSSPGLPQDPGEAVDQEVVVAAKELCQHIPLQR